MRSIYRLTGSSGSVSSLVGTKTFTFTKPSDFSSDFPSRSTIYKATIDFVNVKCQSQLLGVAGSATPIIGGNSWASQQVGSGKDLGSYTITSRFGSSPNVSFPSVQLKFTNASGAFNWGCSYAAVVCEGLPYDFKVSVGEGKGSVEIDWSSLNGYSVNIIATPNKGYKFVYWYDDDNNILSSEANYCYSPGNAVHDTYVRLYAKFAPVDYVVNYYDKSSGEPILIHSKNYIGGNTYEAIAVPETLNIPEGYAAQAGWIRVENTAETVKYGIRNNTGIVYNNETNEKIDYMTSFSKLGTEEGEIINFYFDILPIQYEIKYTSYTGGGISKYTNTTKYRLYNQEINTNLLDLPTPTIGYKLTNQMSETNGPIDSSRLNSWFTSGENLNPGDSTISNISPTLTEDVRVYSFETPINYQIQFHTINQFNEEIDLKTIDCVYNEKYIAAAALEEQTGYKLLGWYQGSKIVDEWYVDSETENLINGEDIYLLHDGEISKTFTTEDQSVHHFYSYYIPYGYHIRYLWIDNFGTDSDKFTIPEVIRLYEKGNVLINTIPDYDEYEVENANTKDWYYFENNDTSGERLINTKEQIESTDINNYIFYAIKHPYKRHITFAPSNEYFGIIEILNKPDDDLYDEGDVITVSGVPFENAYFSNWADGTNLPTREIIVGSSDQHYIGVFRSNQVYINSLGVLAAYKGVKKVREISTPKQAQYNVSYSISNPTQYGFYLNNDNYYESSNKGIANSCALCVINTQSINDCYMHIDCINYAEDDSDFGILSEIDSTLTYDYLVDTENVKEVFKNKQSQDIQTITYLLPAGSHFIQVKYRKDESVNMNNDSLQFKIRFEPR